MANRKSAGPAGPGEVKAAWFMPEQMVRVPIGELVPYARNARTHSESQIVQIRASLREFGFVNPVIIDSDRNIIAGHGRVLAAKAEGMTEVPCVLVEHLTDAQRRAYILADNRLAEQSGWDTEMLALELGEIKADGMDLALTGFDAETMILDDPAALADTLGESKSKSGEPESKPDTPETDTPDAAALAAEAFEAGMAAAEAGEESEEYQAFVDKFKPKKTTDDCYTPAPVYEAVKIWAVDKYGLAGRPIVRPFYPGGDYQKMTYPDGAVVIDNPPFSILAEIVDFYHAHNIDFFLFGPGLTGLHPLISRDWLRSVIAHAAITYENGAAVNTSFVTSLGDAKVTVSPELHDSVEAASRAALEERKAPQKTPMYGYPDEVATAARLGYLAVHGVALEIMPDSCTPIRSLESQRAAGKRIFGGGLLLGSQAAAEKAAAEQAAKEQAEKEAAERAAAEKAAVMKWQLSDAEREIINGLK